MKKTFIKNDTLFFENGNLKISELVSLLKALPFEVLFIDSAGRIKMIIHPLDPGLKLNQRISSHLFFKTMPATFDFLEKLKHGKNSKISRALKVKDEYYNLTFIAIYDEAQNYLGCLQISENITEIIKKYRYGGFIESEFQKSKQSSHSFHYQDSSSEEYRQEIEQDLIDINTDDDSDAISGASEL